MYSVQIHKIDKNFVAFTTINWIQGVRLLTMDLFIVADPSPLPMFIVMS